MTVLIAGLAILAAFCDGRTITVGDDGLADSSAIQASIDDSNDGSTKSFTIIGTEEINGHIYYQFDDYFRVCCFSGIDSGTLENIRPEQ